MPRSRVRFGTRRDLRNWGEVLRRALRLGVDEQRLILVEDDDVTRAFLLSSVALLSRHERCRASDVAGRLR